MPQSRQGRSHDANVPKAGAAALTPELWKLLWACLKLGDCNAQKLADHLGIARSTVHKRTERIGDILGTHSLAAAVAMLVQQGKLAPLPPDDITGIGKDDNK